MDQTQEQYQYSICAIATELFRFRNVFEKMLGKMEAAEQRKYASQYMWFEKKVLKALENAGFRILNVEGKLYDPGMAVTPLNIDEFEEGDELFVQKMIEPIVLQENAVYKEGTVLLGRIEK